MQEKREKKESLTFLVESTRSIKNTIKSNNGKTIFTFEKISYIQTKMIHNRCYDSISKMQNHGKGASFKFFFL